MSIRYTNSMHQVCGLQAACRQIAFQNIGQFSKKINPYLSVWHSHNMPQVCGLPAACQQKIKN